MRWFALVAVVGACESRLGNRLTSGVLPVCDALCQEQAQPDHCVSTQDYFNEYAWPQVFADCVFCHVSGGEADGTRFVMEPENAPGYLVRNFAIVREVAQIREGDERLIFLKPSEALPHQGGRRYSSGSATLAVLQSMVAQYDAPVECEHDTAPPTAIAEGLIMLDAYGALRKASLQLAGRPPTTAEIAAVDAGEPIEPLLDAMMQEEAFYERLREIFNDVLLTDAFRPVNISGTNTDNILSGEYVFPDDILVAGAVRGLRGTEDWDARNNPELVKVMEALSREPVEFVVRAAKDDVSMAQILTSKHRLLNAWSARFFGLPYKGYVGDDVANAPNPDAMVPYADVAITNQRAGTAEYAGILTTTAFLRRYPNTVTNFNRKRARFTYKYFLNFDIMKLAPRLDASTVDLTANPTRNNAQCTGCHAQIDPLAGAFMNWTECGYSHHVVKFAPSEKFMSNCGDAGWNDDLFPPGTGPGDANVITDRSKPLEQLAAAIVAKPAFADAITAHVYTGLMGRTLLNRPADPTHDGYEHLLLAYEAEQAELKRLASVFIANGLRIKPLVKAVVTSPFFVAGGAEVDNRLELLSVGGGSISPPEVLERRLVALFGHTWSYLGRTGPQNALDDNLLLHRTGVKTLYGGIDGTYDGVKQRQRAANSLSAAVSEQMALDLACRHTARDFDKPAAQRKLFPFVDRTLVVSGHPEAPDQQPILTNLRYLHERFAGERLAADDPEILASYQLLASVRADAVTRALPTQLPRPCRNDFDLATRAQATGTTADSTYMVQAWQAAITYLLMDYAFLFER